MKLGRPLLRRALSSSNARALSSSDAPVTEVPEKCEVLVVGGGIIGVSVAYNLAKRGVDDVVLLERHKLTSGTTWHAAGLMVTFGSLSATSTEWRKYSKQLYAETLEAETGLATGFKGCGFIELATDGDRLEEYRRVAAFNRKEGVDVQEISAAEVERLFPLCRVDDVLAGFYVADDGRVNPVDATAALAKGFKNMGGTVVEGVAAEDLITEGRRVAGVATTCGRTIKADYVVNCGGMWARQFAEKHGVCVPNQAAEHYYLVTEAKRLVLDVDSASRTALELDFAHAVADPIVLGARFRHSLCRAQHSRATRRRAAALSARPWAAARILRS